MAFNNAEGLDSIVVSLGNASMWLTNTFELCSAYVSRDSVYTELDNTKLCWSAFDALDRTREKFKMS